MSDDDEYETELREVRRKKGTSRSRSSKSADFESDLQRDSTTRKVAGPTESRAFDLEAHDDQVRAEEREAVLNSLSSDSDSADEFDWSVSDDEPAPASRPQGLTPGQQALADALTAMLTEITTQVMTEIVIPKAQTKWNELSERRQTKKRQRAADKARALKPKATEIEASTPPPVNDPVHMDRSQLLRAQLQARLAEEFLTAQRDLMARAVVLDEDVPAEVERASALVLEGRTTEFTDQDRAILAFFLRQAPIPVQNHADPTRSPG